MFQKKYYYFKYKFEILNFRLVINDDIKFKKIFYSLFNFYLIKFYTFKPSIYV